MNFKSTLMRHSNIGDAWIEEMCRLNPPGHVLDSNGNPTGNLTTGPVRLSFCNLLEPAKVRQNRDGSTSGGKFGTTSLFTPRFDPALFNEALFALYAQEFASHYVAEIQQYTGLHSPFRDQVEKMRQYEGYTPGCLFMTHTSQFKPPVVDINNNPIVDASKVYPGVWAILSVNPYVYGKNPPQPKKGVAFGLQAVMIVADDHNISGAGPADPKQQFAGVSVKPPVTAPSAAFGQPMQHQAPGVAGSSLYQPGPGYVHHAPATQPAPAGDDEDLSQFF